MSRIHLLLKLTPYIKSTQSTTTLPIINKTEFSGFKINIPPLKEQQKIAQVLSLADNEITQSQTKLALLKTQKKGLMQQLLTGKIRVKF